MIVYGGQVFQLDLVMTSVIILAVVAALMYESIVILEKKIVKYADRICAYLKCVEEVNASNREFDDALKSIKTDIDKIDSPEVKYFMSHFVGGFDLTLDKLR